jgi:REP element-mobilizing transposase RayT
VAKVSRLRAELRRAPTVETMPRPPRIQFPGAVYHVTSRGIRKQPIFLDDADRVRFLDLLTLVVVRSAWRCHTYCLMTNHVHLLVETPKGNLSLGMCLLNGLYARRFNGRYGFEGHLFDKRFGAVLVEGESHLLELARYIVLNPVRAGLCADPGDWPWSSYLATIGAVNRPPLLSISWLLGSFGSNVDAARAAFRRFVRDGLAQPPRT